MALTQERINEVFSTLRIIHKSHWKAPKLEDITTEIARKGTYVFRIGADPWVAELVINGKGITYVVNPDLPPRMKQQVEEYKEKFNLALSS